MILSWNVNKLVAMTTLSQSSTLNRSLVSLDLKSVQNGFESKIQNLVILPKVSTRYPPLRVDFNKYPHLSGIPFDFTDGNIQADLLIGMDNAHLLAPLNVRHDPRGNAGPYAILTPFDWTLNGRFECTSVMQSAVVNHVSLEKQVENLWSIDNRDYYTKPMSVTETHVLQLWDNKTEYIDGHYVVPVPWRDGCPSFPDNKFVAKRRLHGLVYQLYKSGRLDKYTHGVVSESKPGKLRTVFDCAASLNGVSFNNQCFKGPDLVNSLLGVLLRFRLYKYAFLADIE